MREYASIEPEMSQSATMAGRRVFVDLRSSGRGHPPVRMLVLSVRRMSMKRPLGSSSWRLVSTGRRSSRSDLMASFACIASNAVISSKSLVRRTSVGENAMRSGISCTASRAGSTEGCRADSSSGDSRAGAREGGFSWGICDRDSSVASASSAPNGSRQKSRNALSKM